MSEFANERLERLLPIFEELQRVQLFTSDEVKRVIKKCKSFEHKLEKRVKDKNDFIRYAQYLIYFLALIRERRRELKYFYKKKEIDYTLGGKIELLFRAACTRFQGDVGLWLSRIEFAKTQHLNISVSRIYVHLLQIHSDKPYLWIAAAKWEFEESGSAENARGLLQRAIRFNSESTKLYLELFRLELLYVDKLKQRHDALLLADPVPSAEGDQTEGSSRTLEEPSDAVLSGKLAQVVFDEAIGKFQGDVKLCTSFTKIALEFPFASDLADYIYTCIDTRYENSEERWLAAAEREYSLNPSDVGSGKTVFEEAITRFSTPKMWLYYINFYLDHLEEPKSDRKKFSAQCLEVMRRASECDVVFDEELYKKWVSLAENDSSQWRVLEMAIARYPQSADLWEALLKWRMANQSTDKEVIRNFNRAVAAVPEKESFPLWRLALNWSMQTCPEKVGQLLKAASIFDSVISGPMKMAHLEWVLLTEGVLAVRRLFRQLCLQKPNSLDFYLAYYEIERAQVALDVDSVRHCFEQALFDHGENSPKIWLTYVEFEVGCPGGDPANVSGIYERAIKQLREDKIEDFIRDYMLLTKQ